MRTRSYFPILMIAILISIFSAACGSSSPTSPSGVGASGGSTATVVTPNDRPAPVYPDFPETEGISCPSDAPLFKASWDHTNTTDLVIKAEWQRMPKAEYVRIYVSRRSVTNIDEPQPFSPVVLGDHGETYGQFAVLDEGVYTLRIATVTCGQERNLSDPVVVNVARGRSTPAPTPTPSPEPPNVEPEPEQEPEPQPCAPAFVVTKADFDFRVNGKLDAADVKVNVSNGGLWTLELLAKQSAGNGGSFILKASDSALIIFCGHERQLRVTQGDHDYKQWKFRVKRNGSTVYESPVYQK